MGKGSVSVKVKRGTLLEGQACKRVMTRGPWTARSANPAYEVCGMVSVQALARRHENKGGQGASLGAAAAHAKVLRPR